MKRQKLIKIAFAVCASVAFAATGNVKAALIYDFDTIWDSSGPPTTAGPWATLTVDQAGANTVKMKLSATNMALGEFISYFKYNFNGSAVSPAPTLSVTGNLGIGPTSFTLFSSTQTDANKTFDAEVNFPTAGRNGGADRFTNGEYLEWTWSRSGLTIDDIDLDMMIHLQGLPNGKSAKIIPTLRDTPEPNVPEGGASVALLGLGLAGVGAARRFMSKKA